MGRVQKRIKNDKEVTFQNIVERIRQKIILYSFSKAYTSESSHSAFSIYKGDSYPISSKPIYICERRYFWNKYFYLNSELKAPLNFKFLPQICKKIDKKMSNNYKWKEKIKRSIKLYKRKKLNNGCINFNSNAESFSKNSNSNTLNTFLP